MTAPNITHRLSKYDVGTIGKFETALGASFTE